MVKKTKNSQLVSIVLALALIVIGILFVISKFADIINVISVILGVALILVGAAEIILSIYQKKSVLNTESFVGGVAICLGICVILDDFYLYILRLVPFLLIAIGALLVIESLLSFGMRKEKNTTLFVLLLVGGLVLIALGICLLVIDDFRAYTALFFGIALILLGVFVLIQKLKK